MFLQRFASLELLGENMKNFVSFATTLLLVLVVGIATSCSKNENNKAAGENAIAASSKEEALSESEVVDIVNAVNEKDVAKVTAMLQTNPKLVKAKFTAGGPYSGWPLLMIATTQGSKPIVELLLNFGADVNEKNDSSEVALHYAALKGHKDIVQILLDHHADVNVKNDAEATPLAAAIEAKKPEIIAVLKQHGAKE